MSELDDFHSIYCLIITGVHLYVLYSFICSFSHEFITNEIIHGAIFILLHIPSDPFYYCIPFIFLIAFRLLLHYSLSFLFFSLSYFIFQNSFSLFYSTSQFLTPFLLFFLFLLLLHFFSLPPLPILLRPRPLLLRLPLPLFPPFPSSSSSFPSPFPPSSSSSFLVYFLSLLSDPISAIK